jgi:hypothetical protein
LDSKGLFEQHAGAVEIASVVEHKGEVVKAGGSLGVIGS